MKGFPVNFTRDDLAVARLKAGWDQETLDLVTRMAKAGCDLQAKLAAAEAELAIETSWRKALYMAMTERLSGDTWRDVIEVLEEIRVAEGEEGS